jgi:hypothetical protein
MNPDLTKLPAKISLPKLTNDGRQLTFNALAHDAAKLVLQTPRLPPNIFDWALRYKKAAAACLQMN